MDETERQRVLCAVRNLKRRADDWSVSVERDKRDLFRCVADLCRQIDGRPVEAVIDLTADEDDDDDHKESVVRVAVAAAVTVLPSANHSHGNRQRPSDAPVVMSSADDDRPLVRRRRRGRRHCAPTLVATATAAPTVPETASATLCDWSAIRACLDDAASMPAEPRMTTPTAPAIGDPPTTPIKGVSNARPTRKRSTTQRPPATVGDRVFVKIDGRRTIGLVLGFDGLSYRMAVPRTDDDDDGVAGGGGCSTPWKSQALILPASGSAMDAADMRARVLGAMGWCGAARQWRNVALPECVVCLDAEADAILGCRCTVPALCAPCAANVTQCPHCDTPVRDGRLSRVAHDLAEVDPSSPWVRVPLRVLRGDATGPLAVRAQIGWPGALLMAVVCEIVGRLPHDIRLLVGGRTIVAGRPLAAQGIADDRLVCVMPRLCGD